MSSQEGRQSPPPETQTGAQLKDTPGSGQGIMEEPNKKEVLQEQVKKLQSNPSHPLEKAVDDKFSKTMEPSTGPQ